MTSSHELLATRGCLCLAARRAARALTREYDRALRAHGLRATQFSTLAALKLRGSMRVSDLADLLGTERTTLTRNLAVAQQRGWLYSTVGADARERIVTISALGLRTLHDALGCWKRVQRQVENRLGEQAAQSLRRISGGPSGPDAGGRARADSRLPRTRRGRQEQ